MLTPKQTPLLAAPGVRGVSRVQGGVKFEFFRGGNLVQPQNFNKVIGTNWINMMARNFIKNIMRDPRARKPGQRPRPPISQALLVRGRLAHVVCFFFPNHPLQSFEPPGAGWFGLPFLFGAQVGDLP